MLKVIGHAYADNNEKLEELVTVLESAGYQVAYDNEINVTVLKEVADE